MRSNNTEIEKFLVLVRKAIDEGKLCFVRRQKNIATLSALGLLPSDIYDEIKNIEIKDYISGPEIDRDYPSREPFWIFKKLILNNLIYIKLKVEYNSNGTLKVVSFHFDEF